jgi:hypothetical protein
MKKKEKMQLTIEVLPDLNNSDTPNIAAELSRELGEAAKVQLTANKAPIIPTRGPDPGLLLQIISVTFAGIGTLIKLATLLKDIRKKKNSSTLIITNPKTGKTVKLSAADSLKRIEKKMLKVLEKEGIKVTFRVPSWFTVSCGHLF